MSLFDRGNMFAAVDVETTGLDCLKHDIWQIAVVPLDGNLDPIGKPFVCEMQPSRLANIDRLAVSDHRREQIMLCPVSAEMALDSLCLWFEKLNLPVQKKLIPVAHNWVFDRSFLYNWMGTLFDSIFHPHPRDTMILAGMLNDLHHWRGAERVFNSLALPNVCKDLGIENNNPHDALNDALAAAAVYKRLLQYELPTALL